MWCWLQWFLRELLEDLTGVDKTKLYVHFERVWQTVGSVNDEQRDLLLKALIEFTEKGFVVNQGSFRQKDYFFPAECYNYAITFTIAIYFNNFI